MKGISAIYSRIPSPARFPKTRHIQANQSVFAQKMRKKFGQVKLATALAICEPVSPTAVVFSPLGWAKNDDHPLFFGRSQGPSKPFARQLKPGPSGYPEAAGAAPRPLFSFSKSRSKGPKGRAAYPIKRVLSGGSTNIRIGKAQKTVTFDISISRGIWNSCGFYGRWEVFC